jgi:hypothetical protein
MGPHDVGEHRVDAPVPLGDAIADGHHPLDRLRHDAPRGQDLAPQRLVVHDQADDARRPP